VLPIYFEGLGPSEYRHPVMTLLFLKRLNDTFEEKAGKLVSYAESEGK
jgi:type I restriction-modification system DNA methylase subunit